MRKNIQLSLFLFLIILLSSFMRYEYFTTMFKLKFKDTAKPADGSVPDLDSIPKKSILIVNKTNDNLNIFIHPQRDENGHYLDNIKKIDNLSSQNVQIGARINWGEPNNNNIKSWNPLGAHPTRQIIIPKNGWVTFNNPIPTPTGGGVHNNQLIIIPIKFDKDNSNTIITEWNGSEETRPVKLKQSPLKFEVGDKVISDSSAVDGINFKIKYQLTNHGKILQTEIVDNPCATLNDRYKLDVGCYSPPKLDCGINEVEAENQATADCISGTQECRFNKCSKKFFKIPSKFSRYERVYDSGKGSSRNKGFGPVKATVAYVDNINTNLPAGKDLKAYCKAVNGESDFTTYCYDYNDVSSSKNLTDPYKIRIEISDLE